MEGTKNSREYKRLVESKRLKVLNPRFQRNIIDICMKI